VNLRLSTMAVLSGTTYIGNVDIALRADMARLARGTDGACADYVRDIHEKLTSLGIVDTDVETFVALTEQAPVT
jgi:cation transport regulator ChaC